jgi:hypothetical protein
MNSVVPAPDFSDLLEVSSLEGPASREALVAGAQVAELIVLGASSSDLDPRAMTGIEFLTERIRAKFTTPAVATSSNEELLALWGEVAPEVLRLMDAIAVHLYEAGQAHGSDHIFRRLEHGDRTALSAAAQEIGEGDDPSASEALRSSVSLIEAARARLVDLGDRLDVEDPRLVKGFHVGVLVWGLGGQLCLELSERLKTRELAREPIRAGLAAEFAEFASAGARQAALFAAFIAGLEGLPPTLQDYLDSPIERTRLVTFLLQASVEIPRVFGPEVRYALDSFDYPDEPDARELHLVIDTASPPAEACERLEQLCDGWWDEAVAELEFDLFPVLGVLDDE